jgi:hypothetical protein
MEIMDLRAEVNERGLIGGPSVYEVVVVTDSADSLHYQSPVFYRTRREAQKFADRINNALFADRCNVCGLRSLIVEDLGNLAHDPTDITSFCSPECYEESERESDALARARR